MILPDEPRLPEVRYLPPLSAAGGFSVSHTDRPERAANGRENTAQRGGARETPEPASAPVTDPHRPAEDARKKPVAPVGQETPAPDDPVRVHSDVQPLRCLAPHAVNRCFADFPSADGQIPNAGPENVRPRIAQDHRQRRFRSAA